MNIVKIISRGVSLKRLGRLGVPGIILAVVLLAFLCIVLFYNSEIGMASDVGIREPVFTNVDFSSVPPSVIEDAAKMADELVGSGSANYQNTVNQLVVCISPPETAISLSSLIRGGWGGTT